MKCKHCGNEMTEYHRSKHADFLEFRYRCDACGWETVEIKDIKPPKKDKED